MNQPVHEAQSAIIKKLASKLTLMPLVMVLFFTVSGGAYGLEDLVSASGPGLALVLIVITPLIWSLPVALMVGELSTAMPEEGGYYVWVKRGLSPYWGFQVAWFSWLMSFVDMAIYPVLFANYLSALMIQYLDSHWLEQSELLHWLVTLVVIWTFAALNIRGAKTVGDYSKLFGFLVLSPFMVMTLIAAYQWCVDPRVFWEPWVPPDRSVISAFGVGLFVVMWNYMGWDIIANIAGEIENPQRNLPLAMAIAIPLVTLAYLLPVVAGLVSGLAWQDWTAGFFPELATAIGGKWLGLWLGVAGLVSSAGLFNALLLSFSRVPFVLAEDRYLPDSLTRLHPLYETPYVSIIVCAAIYSCFTLSTFASLIVVDVVLYAAVLMLEFAALIALRINEPELVRPFRVPGGWIGLGLIALFPLALLALAMYSTLQEEGVQVIYWSMIALASGFVAFPSLRRNNST